MDECYPVSHPEKSQRNTESMNEWIIETHLPLKYQQSCSRPFQVQLPEMRSRIREEKVHSEFRFCGFDVVMGNVDLFSSPYFPGTNGLIWLTMVQFSLWWRTPKEQLWMYWWDRFIWAIHKEQDLGKHWNIDTYGSYVSMLCRRGKSAKVTSVFIDSILPFYVFFHQF